MTPEEMFAEWWKTLKPFDSFDSAEALAKSAFNLGLAAWRRLEREECAKIALTTGRLHPLFADEILQGGIADAIRERGTT